MTLFDQAMTVSVVVSSAITYALPHTWRQLRNEDGSYNSDGRVFRALALGMWPLALGMAWAKSRGYLPLHLGVGQVPPAGVVIP